MERRRFILTLPHSLNPLDYPARSQWQGNNDCLSQTACTDCAIQMIIEYWLEKTISLADIRRAAGGRNDCVHGLTIAESLQALRYYGITWYAYAMDQPTNFIMRKTLNGPVLTGVAYGWYPNKKGSCDSRITAENGGRTDCGFIGPHAILTLKYQRHINSKGTFLHWDVITRDPDHQTINSNFDRMTLSQFGLAYQRLDGIRGWTHTFCLYPAKKKTL